MSSDSSRNKQALICVRNGAKKLNQQRLQRIESASPFSLPQQDSSPKESDPDQRVDQGKDHKSLEE